jgi:hypothetical protein
MSTNSIRDYIFAESTPKLHNLARKAGDEIRQQAITATETPVSKLTYTSGYGEITAEYYRAHHKTSSIAAVLDYQKIKKHYKPEVFALIDRPIWIRPHHTAVMIPLLESGDSKLIVTSRPGATYDVA